MTISDYLLKNHLKPLFIFKINDEKSPECFGVFVGSRGKDSTNVNFGDLTWDNKSGEKPSWDIETPLWIIPLVENNEVFSLRYVTSEKNIELPKKIITSFINIVDQKSKTDWSNYDDLDEKNILRFSHFLNFEAKEFLLLNEKKYNHTITTSDNKQSIPVWLIGDSKIKTSERLIKFSGIECDIVDANGIKHDFDIWVGIRKTNKVFLAINNSDENYTAQKIGTDCPLVWSKKGLVDDTIFPDQDTKLFTTENNKLSLKNYFMNDSYLSYYLAQIDFNEENTPMENYNSWLIKEGDSSGKGKNLYPFFKYVKPGLTSKKLNAFFFSTYKQAYFFQINRYNQNSGNQSKHIITWVPGSPEKDLAKIFESTAVSRSNTSKSGQESLSPIIEDFKLTVNNQIVLEHIISDKKVSFKHLRLYNKADDPVSSIDKLDDVILEKQTIKLPNLRLSNFNRKNLLIDKIEYDLTDYFDFESFKFTSEGIGRELDNGTFFGFKIQTDGTQQATKKGIFNDGSFSFTLDKTQKIEGNIFFSLQLQKAQKPLYLWEWYEELEENDTIIPCFSIEDFKLPVSLITPLSSDLSQQDRFIADDDSSSLASSGNLRPTPPLIIPLISENSRKYYLSLSENINVGQDYNFSAEIEVNNDKAQQDTKKAKLSAVVLGSQPQTALKIETPFGTDTQQDDGKWIVARKNNLSADGGMWEILNEEANETGIMVTFPPQIIGEAFRKTDKKDGITIIEGEPEEEKLVQFKFGPPAQLQIANEQLNRQMVTAPWNLRYLFGSYGDSNPGLRLLKAQFELLYGMSANFENKDAFIAELENKLGQLVKAPRGRIVWQSNKQQNDAFEDAYSDFVRLLSLFNSRLAIYEVSGNDKFQPAKFNDGIDYFFRVDYIEDANIKDETERKKNATKKGAKLKWPFQGEVPEYLKNIKEQYHRDNGLAGGFHFGFESMAVYKELWETGIKKGSSSGEIENLAFTSLGGYGKQVARFANDKSIIKSTTSLGRTHFYAVERIGRIGVFWNKAKHVIEYERTVVPSNQFRNTENVGRVIMRKVREFVEILEPERKYPEFGAEPSSAGSILGTRFKSIKIPVSSSWGTDITRKNPDTGKEEPIGWEVPLWNTNADKSIYPFPQIMLSVLASKESQLNEVLCNLSNPENLYFYTDVRESTTSFTDEWPSVLNVDYTLQPFEHIYLNVNPCLDCNDTKLVNTPLPSPLEVLPGFERYTFRITPSDVPISVNGAYNKDSNVVGKLRTATMQRKPTLKTKNNGESILYINEEQQNHVDNFHGFLNKNLNGYTSVLKNPSAYRNIDDLKELVVEHIRSVANINNNFNPLHLKELTDSINTEPDLRYLNKKVPGEKDYNLIDFNKARKPDWEIPTAALWFKLTKELDSGIGAVDKNYTLLFREMQKELNQLIRETRLDDLKKDIIKPIELFSHNLTDLNSQVDINLNRFDALVNSETEAITSYLENSYDTMATKIDAIIRKAKDSIDSIIDPTITLNNFKTKIDSEIKVKINTFLKDIIDGINVNKRIKDAVTGKLNGLIKDGLIKAMDDYLSSLDDVTFKLQKAKDELNKQLSEGLETITSELGIFKNEVKKIKDAIITEVKMISTSISSAITEFKRLLDETHKVITNKIEGLKTSIEAINADKIQYQINLFFATTKIDGQDKFDRIEELLNELIITIQVFLIKDYLTINTHPVPPIAHLFEQADQWLKDRIKDFKSFLNKFRDKLGGSIDLIDFENKIEENYDKFKTIYKEFKQLEEAIESGKPDAIIKEANALSQAINADFGHAIGEVSKTYYNPVELTNTYKELDTDFKSVLFNYRSVFEEIKAVDLGFNRQTMELVFNFKETKAPRLLLTPVMGKLQKLNDGLNSMGISIPYAGLEEKFVAPLKEWGEKFTKSLAQEFPISNLLNDLGGIKFDNLFPFLKGDDAFMKAVKITHNLDKEALKAWVKADVDYTFKDDNTFMNIGPVKVTMLRNARITAQAYESIDIDRSRTSENTGALKATFEISLSGAPLMLFKETLVSFKNGKYDFDLDPSRMEMPGLMKLLTDASKNIKTAAPTDDGKGSPFKLEILKINRNIGGKDFELPIGAQATLDIPPLSIGGGPTSMSNLSFGGNFIMKAIDDRDINNLKLDFMVGLGFYFGKRDLPFNFTAFILGGGGFIECNFRYKPSVSGAIQVNFVMSVHASAALSLSAGWISGTIMILAGIEVEYNSGAGGGTRIEIFIAIIGVVDILGLISIYLGLRLSINYLSDGNGTVLYGVGTVKCKIKICAFVTININRSHTTVLKGESKSVSNSRSESISASLN